MTPRKDDSGKPPRKGSVPPFMPKQTTGSAARIPEPPGAKAGPGTVRGGQARPFAPAPEKPTEGTDQPLVSRVGTPEAAFDVVVYDSVSEMLITDGGATAAAGAEETIGGISAGAAPSDESAGAPAGGATDRATPSVTEFAASDAPDWGVATVAAPPEGAAEEASATAEGTASDLLAVDAPSADQIDHDATAVPDDPVERAHPELGVGAAAPTRRTDDMNWNVPDEVASAATRWDEPDGVTFELQGSAGDDADVSADSLERLKEAEPWALPPAVPSPVQSADAVADALWRIAERVRQGEIVLPPGWTADTDEAALAIALAALLRSSAR